MRICVVYDCLFPYTIGGGERWYRNLAERLHADGHEVTYLTLRQWERGGTPQLPGIEVRTRGYWRDYLGPAGGRVGWAVQKLCLRVPQRAFTLARATAERLRAEG